MSLLTGCPSLGGVQSAILYSSYEMGPHRPTDSWCGNRPRGGRTAPCESKATNAAGQMPMRKIEVRGWVLNNPYYNEGENELIFNLLLDHGWLSAVPAQTDPSEAIDPINTIARINEVLTPHNIVAFGEGPDNEATAWLGNDAWGGPNALAIHVEVNGWGRRPGTDTDRARSWPPPAGWVVPAATGAAGSAPGVAWAFDPWDPPALAGLEGRVAKGDYVRMVGMLWEDSAHEDSGEDRPGVDGDRTRAGKQCWKSGRHDRGNEGRGFAELHPVDYLAKVTAPARADKLYAVALCGDGASIREQVSPPGARPSATAHAAFEEFIDGEFTNLGTVTGKRITANPDHVLIDVTVRDRTGSNLEPKFKAIYRIYWEQ